MLPDKNAIQTYNWMAFQILTHRTWRKVSGGRSAVERLVEYERQQNSNATRLICLQNAIQRWERENS